MAPTIPACALSLLLVLGALGARAASRPAVVELYTSQGCSSCPPADALLGELRSRPGVLALAFHVDYWDGLGWPDRFALPFAGERQGRYARALHLASAFTPQVIVDGERSFVGADRAGILPALAGARGGIEIDIGAHGSELEIDVGADTASAPAAAAAAAEVLLLAIVPDAQTAIGRGENGGRTLREFNIVRAVFALGEWHGGERRYALSRSALPADASSVAVLVQQAGQRSILGAASFAWR